MSEKKGNQLHQLLAVEQDRRTKANIILTEAMTTFSKKADHFDGIIKTYTPFKEEGTKIPPETKEIVTTVSDKLKYIQNDTIKSIDAQLSKEETNASGVAIADLKVGDTDLGKFSATSLLALESQLTNLRNVYKTIPTLDPSRAWRADKASGNGIYITDPEVKFRTEKEHEPITLAKATDKHAAQVQLVSIDRQVGKYETVYKSGKITPAEKSTLLGRIDDLIDTVKRARAKANQAEVKNVKVAKKILDFINKDILS